MICVIKANQECFLIVRDIQLSIINQSLNGSNI